MSFEDYIKANRKSEHEFMKRLLAYKRKEDAMILLAKIDNEINSINQDCRLEIHVNRNTQLKIDYHYRELMMIDIEPDFNGEKYKGIPIIVDDNLKDEEFEIITKPI